MGGVADSATTEARVVGGQVSKMLNDIAQRAYRLRAELGMVGERLEGPTPSATPPGNTNKLTEVRRDSVVDQLAEILVTLDTAQAHLDRVGAVL